MLTFSTELPFTRQNAERRWDDFPSLSSWFRNVERNCRCTGLIDPYIKSYNAVVRASTIWNGKDSAAEKQKWLLRVEPTAIAES
jgi:hypothetical protein